MIHSLAGGSLREKRVEDFALVEISDGVLKGSKFWYLVGKLNVDVGTGVVVPLGARDTEQKAKIIRVDRGVAQGQTPVPLNRAKYIIRRMEG